MTFHFSYPTPLPSTKGWGSGWPNCQAAAREGTSIFWPGVHRDIGELVGLLVEEMRRRGFRFMDPGCWGFGCRGTKASSGSGTGTPSFHSWGLGIDINAPENVFGSAESQSKIATRDRWVVPLMASYGFFWLGPPIRDWMHFSFCGSPQDAADMTAKARRELGDEMTDAEKQQLARAVAVANGVADFFANKEPPADAHPDRKRTYNSLKRAESRPAPGTPGPHGHDEYALRKHPHVVTE
jgi:hypothetical protein